LKSAIALLIATLIGILGGPSESMAARPTAAAANLKTTSAVYQHGQARIRITQSLPQTESTPQTSPRYCRASLRVESKGKKTQQFNYDDILPYGFSYGLFVPSKPVIENYFMVIKEGDYDGTMYLIHKNGKVHQIPGGYYFVDARQRLLFITHAMDCNCGAAVFSLPQGKLLHRMDTSHIQQWYRKGDTYFFTTEEWDGSRTYQGLYRYDAQKGKLIRSLDKAVNVVLMSNAVPVRYDFDPTRQPDCQAKP
jgi:hypothetical protein